MPNRLINETSPYLLQHAYNPVDWYAWGEEALERAKAEDRPILLSVGYSACHWCHVMERESFENNQIAAIMNENFVCIKVDREERPDIDSIYMKAVQAMTGQGGWPMTVFLTPDAEPFYGGTYFPPKDRGPLPGFPKVLQAVRDHYDNQRDNVTATTERLLDHMRKYTLAGQSPDTPSEGILDAAKEGIGNGFDDQHGGIGTQPKFPQPMTYEFLLRYHLRTGDPQALEIVDLTLDRMANGGIYDQVGGGFHRYSTDMFWLVPHFEKMLYDNALLVKLYLHGYQVTGKPLYRQIVEETLAYVLREMTDEAGGFYSAQDADSEEIEGKYFVWRPEEIVHVLGQEHGELLKKYYGVTKHGNFEARTILSVSDESKRVREQSGLSEDEFDDLLERSKAGLLAYRDLRIKPERDDKVLTAWNGLMLRAFAEAASVLGRRDYAEVAERNAAFLLDTLKVDDRLLRTYKEGQAKLNAYLEDYAFLIDGLLALHEATFGPRWLAEAAALGETMVDLFWDEDEGRFYDTSRNHESLLIRPRDPADNAIPAGSSIGAEVMLRLAVVTGDREMRRRGAEALRSVQGLMSGAPSAAGQWLCALDFYLSDPNEVAIIGRRGNEATEALAAELYRSYLPNRVVVGRDADAPSPVAVPLLQDRDMVRALPTAYVCRDYVCQLPVTEPEALTAQLAS